MTDNILQEILNASNLPPVDKDILLDSLQKIEAALPVSHDVPKERWLSIGNHMSEAIIRAINKEELPPIDDDMSEEIEKRHIEKSQQIFSDLPILQKVDNKTEILLLAIHLQCAENNC